MPAVELNVFTKLSGKLISTNESLLPFEIRQRKIFVSALVSLRLLEVTKARGRNEKEKLYSNSQLADDDVTKLFADEMLYRIKKNPTAIIMYTAVSMIPSNQLLFPSCAIKFNINAARKTIASS
jgi:hypothetical protein